MIYKIIEGMNAETTTFIAIILILTLYFHLRYTAQTIYKAPAILTTMGILGTFVGIAIGLLDFNANNIQKSVPALIDGIKTAVWVSAFGIFCAITVKLREVLFGVPKKISSTTSSGSTIDDLATILTSVQQALVGNDDSTIITQLKLARQDSNDRMDKLSKAMDEFCNKVAESNSKALIQALEEVIKDFNAKINEQFGENFKQLNLAVGKILEWQEQYRQQMAEMIEQQGQTSKNMATATERYQNLVGQAEGFSNTANNLSKLLTALETQRKELDGALQTLANLINTAAKSFPEIEKNINEMTRQVGEGVKATNEQFKTMLVENIKNSNQEFNSHIKQMVEKTKEQIVALDKALAEELNKSLESLGRQLAALSNKFVDDYTPLTEKLQKVLTIVK